MNKKLFRKLNEQMEINEVKRSMMAMTEEQKAAAEKKMIFGDSNSDIVSMINFAEKR